MSFRRGALAVLWVENVLENRVIGTKSRGIYIALVPESDVSLRPFFKLLLRRYRHGAASRSGFECAQSYYRALNSRFTQVGMLRDEFRVPSSAVEIRRSKMGYPPPIYTAQIL